MKTLTLLAIATLMLAVVHSTTLAADPDTKLFPFSLPGDDITEGVTDLSFLNTRPANDPVTVRDGHFYAGDERVRFWGVCVIGMEAFPTHEDATLLARRLANRGFNQARIHLIDGSYAPRGLFDPNHKGELRIVPAQIERLDYLIAELKKRGIYVELSVHGYHWRNVSGGVDYPDADLQKLVPFSSGIPLWNDRFIAAEKQFARDFFGHTNPYTGLAYTEEPAVSTLEVLNENGVLCAWRGGHFRKAWPEAMVADLQGRWNDFLKARYGATDKLRAAWAGGEVLPGQDELLKNNAFGEGEKAWGLQCAKPSEATMEVAVKAGPEGQPCVVLESNRAAAPLAFVNVHQTGLEIQKGVRYKLSFWGKADGTAGTAGALARMGVSVSMNHPPWSSVGLGARAELGSDWKETTLFFIGTQDEKDAKIMLEAPVGPSRISLAHFSLQRAEILGLPPRQSLEASSVAMPLTPQDCINRTEKVAQDFVDFLYEIDARYFDGMRDFLVHDLHCRHPIKGTQVDQYSSYFSQARYDYLDSHGYWQHPSFPNKPYDREDWTVGNSPMINAGEETAVKLAERRVRGEPFNVSEYCHPAPSTFCAEQVPTISAIGALQDWDGIVFHCWQEMTYDWNRHEARRLPADRIEGWFNMTQHPVKQVTLPFGALAFRRGDVAVARQEVVTGATLAQEKEWMADNLAKSWQTFDPMTLQGATWRDALTHRISLALGKDDVPRFLAPEVKRTMSDTGEIACDLSDTAAGVMTVNAPKAKAVIGFGAGRTFELGDVTVQPGPTRQSGFSVITASVVQGDGFRAPGGRILVTATGYVENQGMVWNAAKTSVGSHWGDGPVMCEGIPFELKLKANHATAWPLDSRGRRLDPLPGKPGPEGIRFAFGPSYKTLWYEIATE